MRRPSCRAIDSVVSTFLVVNPVAGRGRAFALLPTVREAFARAGVALTVLVTERPGHATALAQATPGDATILAMGGDGTVHEVARACIDSGRTLGVVPVGSGDDFAFASGLARGDVEAAVRVALEGHVRLVDTGVCNGEPFVNAAGIGFDAEVSARMRSAPAPLTGFGAYLWGVAVALSQLASVPMRVWGTDRDGAERLLLDGPSLLTSAQNGPRTGGSFLFAPLADVADGSLDVVIAKRVGRLGTLSLLPKALRGRHLSDPRVAQARVVAVRIEAASPRAWHTDGEVFSPTSSFSISVRPRSLRVLAPL